MLIIRSEQLSAFEEAQTRRFEGEMVLHIRSFSPKSWETLGEQGVRDIVGTGMERARSYGFSNRGTMRFFIEMMFMFGKDFDTDPQYPWAREVLVAEGLNQLWRADRLHELAMEQANREMAPDWFS